MKRIKKVLLLIVFSITIMFPCACSQGNVVSTDNESEDTTKNTDTTQYSTEVKWSKLQKTGSEMLEYAEQFAIDYYEGGYALLTIYDSGKYLIVPENNTHPTLEDIRRFCKENISAYKCPRKVAFVEALPVNNADKPDRRSAVLKQFSLHPLHYKSGN